MLIEVIEKLLKDRSTVRNYAITYASILKEFTPDTVIQQDIIHFPNPC